MKKRSKKYRPRHIVVLAIVGNQNIFAAPMKLLSDIRHGYVLAVNGDVVMLSIGLGEMYSAVDTLRLFSKVLPEIAEAAGETLDATPLLLLANRLEHDMPIDDAALTPVDRLFERGQRLGNTLAPAQFYDIYNRGE